MDFSILQTGFTGVVELICFPNKNVNQAAGELDIGWKWLD